MLATDVIRYIMEYAAMLDGCDMDSRVRIHIGNLLYDISHIDTTIDMDTNKQNIVIHVEEK